eukprot:CAMPEP_0197551408 /NCGR_PEP_ID=MMETSP1320-20131121/4684_1 /TAXON_ID=91990 /ORGANISM="Bolidomonas sp., Strain RCC2347" /LENGTH=88 /DNA_ID=CAMNT_0043111901 /DNA_START=358 /DNA_END=624 /DNA_ORIENTATION=+
MGCSTVQSDKGLATPEDEDVAVEHDEVKEEGEVKRERTPSPPPATEYAFPSSHTTPWGTEVFPDRDWTQGRWGAVRVTGVCGMERSER